MLEHYSGDLRAAFSQHRTTDACNQVIVASSNIVLLLWLSFGQNQVSSFQLLVVCGWNSFMIILVFSLLSVNINCVTYAGVKTVTAILNLCAHKKVQHCAAEQRLQNQNC